MTRKDFFDKYARWAIDEQIRSGVPASITLAQAGIESGWGESQLTKQACNFFGIKKGYNWKGETAVFPTPLDPTPTSEFRKYPSPRESFRDHSDFLIQNPRYKGLFNDNDYKNWATELEQYGYSTSSNYAETIISVIETNKLYEYDKKAVKKKRSFTLGSVWPFSLWSGWGSKS